MRTRTLQQPSPIPQRAAPSFSTLSTMSGCPSGSPLPHENSRRYPLLPHLLVKVTKLIKPQPRTERQRRRLWNLRKRMATSRRQSSLPDVAAVSQRDVSYRRQHSGTISSNLRRFVGIATTASMMTTAPLCRTFAQQLKIFLRCVIRRFHPQWRQSCSGTPKPSSSSKCPREQSTPPTWTRCGPLSFLL